jgi:cytochrome P450
VAQISRDAAACERMADRDVEPGAVVFCPPWILHRQPRFWTDPDAFAPDRFETEAGREAARQAYFPFSMGPRVCPGAAFALQEATLALAMLARRFAFAPAPGRAPEPVGRLTLRSGNGVALVVRPAGAGWV